MTEPAPVSQSLLDVVAIIVVASCVVLAVAIVLARVVADRRRARTRDRLSGLRPALLTAAAGEDIDGAARRTLVADRTAGPELDRAVVDLLTKVRGTPADELVEVLRSRDGVQRTLRGLHSRSSVQRARSTRTLGLLRDPDHVDELVGRLSDRSREVRLVAARAIGEIGPDAGSDAAEALLASVRTQGSAPGVPADGAIGALVRLGAAAQGPVRHGLDAADPGVRNVAATVAGHNLMTGCVPRLAQLALADPDLLVRVSATVALGCAGRPSNVGSVTVLLDQDEPSQVRRAAARALGELGAPEGLTALVSLLDDADRGVALAAAEALAASGPGRTLMRAVVADAGMSDEARSAVRGVLELQRLRDAGSETS